MTFAAILTAIYDEANYAGTPVTAVVTRMKRFVNEGVRHVLSQPGLSRLEDSDLPYTFTTTAGTARYTVPDAVAAIRCITERTNNQTLDVMALDAYRHQEPNPTTTSGTPSRYVPIGRVAVALQATDGAGHQLFAKSTDAADTTQVVRAEGVTSGETTASSGTLNGLTAVGLVNFSFNEVTDWYLSAVAAGTVSLHLDSGAGTQIARVVAGKTRPRYYAFYLWPTPAAAVTYYVDYRREVVDLVNDLDEPPLPTDYHPMLVAYAVMREAERTGNTDLLQSSAARYQGWMNRLKYQTQTLADETPVMGGGRWVGRSRLGGYYPADILIRG